MRHVSWIVSVALSRDFLATQIREAIGVPLVFDVAIGLADFALLPVALEIGP